MRTIVKGVAPACLEKAERRGMSWDDFVKNDQDGYKSSRQQANVEQHGVCGYTEVPLDVSRVTIHFDHFRKKSIYPKLRFKWDNLFAAIKDRPFGADYKDKIVDGDNHNIVYANIFSPLTPHLQDYFHYATNGEIEPSNGLSEENRHKAEETIRVFNLNAPELVSRRRTIIEQISFYQELSEEEIRSCFIGQGFLSVVDQEIRYKEVQGV